MRQMASRLHSAPAGMKILYGYVRNRKPEYLSERHDMKCFGEGDFATIWNNLPDGWEPDIVLFSDPAYHLIPEGIEESPYPTAAIIGDWNLSFEALREAAGSFDCLFTDRKGVEIFKGLGCGNVEYFPMFSFDPRMHYPIPDAEKIYDICFIGNLNHAVQRERGAWLKRIALLSKRYKVIIASGIYGSDYTRLLNQSRIVFNRSIRGEMNMRAYEAPACRTLLFLEEENLEVRDFYEDRRHCILYNEGNLEELIDYYLLHEEEREEIAKRGYERVQDLTHARRMENLLGWIEKNLDRFRPERRKMRGYPLAERRRIQAVQAFRSITPGSLERASSGLERAITDAPENPELWNNFGAVRAEQGFREKSLHQQSVRLEEALGLFQKAVEINESYSPGWFNKGCCHYFREEWEASEDALRRAIAAAEENRDDLASLSGLYCSAPYDAFQVENEKNAFNYPDRSKFHEEKRRLLLWKYYDLLGDTQLKKGDPAMARQAYEHSLEKRPDMAETRYKLGQILEWTGEFDDALHQYQEANRHNPFLFVCWEWELNLLSLMGRWKEAGEKGLQYRTALQALSDQSDLLFSLTAITIQSLSRHVRELMATQCCEGALSYLRKMMEIDEDNPKVYSLLGECAFSLRKYEEAEAWLLRALDLTPGDDDVLISLGVVCHMQNRKGEALAYFRRAGEINPGNPDLLANYRAIA